MGKKGQREGRRSKSQPKLGLVELPRFVKELDELSKQTLHGYQVPSAFYTSLRDYPEWKNAVSTWMALRQAELTLKRLQQDPKQKPAAKYLQSEVTRLRQNHERLEKKPFLSADVVEILEAEAGHVAYQDFQSVLPALRERQRPSPAEELRPVNAFDVAGHVRISLEKGAAHLAGLVAQALASRGKLGSAQLDYARSLAANWIKSRLAKGWLLMRVCDVLGPFPFSRAEHESTLVNDPRVQKLTEMVLNALDKDEIPPRGVLRKLSLAAALYGLKGEPVQRAPRSLEYFLSIGRDALTYHEAAEATGLSERTLQDKPGLTKIRIGKGRKPRTLLKIDEALEALCREREEINRSKRDSSF